MFRAAAKAVVPAARTAARQATRRPITRKLATKAAGEHIATPSAEELKRVMEFEKFVDRRLAYSLKDIIAKFDHLETKMDAALLQHTLKIDATLLRHTLSIIGMFGTITVGGVTLAYRGG